MCQSTNLLRLLFPFFLVPRAPLSFDVSRTNQTTGQGTPSRYVNGGLQQANLPQQSRGTQQVILMLILILLLKKIGFQLRMTIRYQ